MKSARKHAPFLVALCLLVHPLLAADGILLVETTTTGGTTKTNQIQMEKTRMRTESADAKGTTTVVVFDAAAQVMRMIDVPKKSYTETTKEEADRMGAQMTDTMAKMQEQLKNIPPAQRAQMEAMMKNMPGMGAVVAKTEYKKVGTDKVGKWTCDKYEGYQNGKKTSELCTVDPKALGLTDADFEVTQQLGEFFVKMMPQNADQGFSLGKNEPSGYSGVPVRRIYSVLGKETVSELTEVSHQTFADAIFAVPEGFQKKAFGR